MGEVKSGQILAIVNNSGLLALNENMDAIPADETIGFIKRIYSRKIPVGEILLCLEVVNIYTDDYLRYHLKILWKENIYYIICNHYDVRVI
jgi:hypothetical protein